MNRVSIHPSGIEHLTEFYSSLEKTYQIVAKMRKRGTIKHVGTAQVYPEGRPRDVFYNGRPPESDQLVHEYHLTTFCLLYPEADWKRLLDTDRTIRPDAEMRVPSGKHYFVEMHTGTVHTTSRIRERFRAYEHSRDDVLWVCLHSNDMHKLISLCDDDNMYFTTLDTVVKNPCGPVWIDRENQACEIE